MYAEVRLVQDKFVSSASIKTIVVCKQCGRSLIRTRNSKAPSPGEHHTALLFHLILYFNFENLFLSNFCNYPNCKMVFSLAVVIDFVLLD